MSNKIIKGKRPEFFETQGVDYLMHMVMTLAQELSATRDRLETFEKLAEKGNLIAADDIETYVPSQDELEQREARRQTFLTNMFSVMAQEAAEVSRKDTKERFEKVIDDLAS